MPKLRVVWFDFDAYDPNLERPANLTLFPSVQNKLNVTKASRIAFFMVIMSNKTLLSIGTNVNPSKMESIRDDLLIRFGNHAVRTDVRNNQIEFGATPTWSLVPNSKLGECAQRLDPASPALTPTF